MTSPRVRIPLAPPPFLVVPLLNQKVILKSQHQHEKHMQRCLELAQEAASRGEVPVGALIIDDKGQIVSEAVNDRENSKSATAHAELLAIELACNKLQRWRLHNCTLYVTLEPCFMCAGAIVLARIPTVIYGACDPKAGAVHSLANILNDDRLNHRCKIISGVLENESSQLLKQFFKSRRKK